MSSAFDQMCSDQKSPPSDPRNLRKSFRNLKIYTSKLAQFVLQWQDLEDHFLSIKTQVEHLAKTQKIETLRRKNGGASSEPSIQSQNQNPDIKTETCEPELSVELPDENPETKNSSIPIDSGKSLIVYLNEHVKEHDMLKNTVYEVIKGISNPEKLVLQALRLFYPSNDLSIDLSVTRKNCVFLLEELNRVGPLVNSQVRKEALELALYWEIMMNNSLEVLGFLMLVAVFGLADEFSKHEILKHFDRVVQLEQAPELFRAFGFADKAHDFIQKLIRKNKRLEAIPFIYAFELVDKFPPVPLLRAHSEYAEETCKKIYKKGNNSLNAFDNATGTQLAALRGILKLIMKYKLHSEYSPEIIRNRILQLEKQKEEKKAAEVSPKTVMQPKKHTGNKRDAPTKAQSDEHDTYKRLRGAELTSGVSFKAAGNTTQAPVLYRSRDSLPFSLSSGRTEPATRVAYSPVNGTLTHHSMQSPRMHTSNFISGQGAQQLVSSSGLYNFAGAPPVTMPSNHVNGTVGTTTSTQELNAMAGQYGSGVSFPFNRQFTSLVGPYSPSVFPQLSPLVSRYHSNVTNGETGQLRGAGFSYTNWHGN